MPSSLPIESCYFSLEEFEVQKADEIEENELKRNRVNIYTIRDRDIICSLEVQSQDNNVLNIYPGGVIACRLNFENSKQKCSAVRGRIMQIEERLDGSKVQVTKLYIFIYLYI